MSQAIQILTGEAKFMLVKPEAPTELVPSKPKPEFLKRGNDLGKIMDAINDSPKSLRIMALSEITGLSQDRIKEIAAHNSSPFEVGKLGWIKVKELAEV